MVDRSGGQFYQRTAAALSDRRLLVAVLTKKIVPIRQCHPPAPQPLSPQPQQLCRDPAAAFCRNGEREKIEFHVFVSPRGGWRPPLT